MIIREQISLWDRPVEPSDIVYTPVNISKQIIDYLKPSGKLLDPCKGDGSFFNNFPNGGGIAK